MHQQSVISAITLLLATAPSAAWAALYPKNSDVLQVDAHSYGQLINKSNYTSIVKFYASWCGHCQNLKPAYEKASKMLQGLAKVAIVDCDADINKQFCGTMGVKGFPTLKIVRPRLNKPGKPVVEDYAGGRTAGAIAEAVTSKINNHVVRVTDKNLDDFLSKNDRPKAILFSDKGITSALLRSIAIDYLDVISIAQIRNKESEAVARFKIEKFPTLVLIPKGESQEPIMYDGELKKDAMVKFLRQAGEPNPDPPSPVKTRSGDKKAKGDKKATKGYKAKESKPKYKKANKAESSTQDPVQEADTSSETSSEAAASPAATPNVVAITTASNKQQVAEKCLQPKSHTCILALIPASETPESQKAIESLSQLNTKYIRGQRKAFSFFAIPDSVDDLSFIRDKLQAKNAVEVVATNARRSWWRKYEGDFDVVGVEAWADAIRMGEGSKMKLPSGIIEDVVEKPAWEEINLNEATGEETETEKPKAETAESKVDDAVAEENVKEVPLNSEAAAEEHDEL